MAAFRELRRRQDRLGVSSQSIREFWNVSTRPATARGGYGRSVERTIRWVNSFDRIMRILPETPATLARWRELVELHNVNGIQVHDTNLVAVADIYGAGAIITLNSADFTRFPTIKALTPEQVASASLGSDGGLERHIAARSDAA